MIYLHFFTQFQLKYKRFFIFLNNWKFPVLKNFSECVAGWFYNRIKREKEL